MATNNVKSIKISKKKLQFLKDFQTFGNVNENGIFSITPEQIQLFEDKYTENKHTRAVAEEIEEIEEIEETEVTNKLTGLNISKLKKLDACKNFIPPPSQLDYYKKHNAPDDILKYVKLQGSSFGCRMEPIASEYFNLGPRPVDVHTDKLVRWCDHTKCGKTIEQKSARYHANGGEWKWEHIEMKHPWEFLLVTGLDFRGIKYYIAPKKIVEKLIIENIITGQGGKNEFGISKAQQGYWFLQSNFTKRKVAFADYFKEVKTEDDIIKYLSDN
jgi:hypothetical protein